MLGGAHQTDYNNVTAVQATLDWLSFTYFVSLTSYQTLELEATLSVTRITRRGGGLIMRRAGVLEAHGRKAGRQEVPGQSVLEENETLLKEGEGEGKRGRTEKASTLKLREGILMEFLH